MSSPSHTTEPPPHGIEGRRPSIRTVVAVTMIVPTVALTATLVLLATTANQAVGDRLARTALREASGRVESELLAYFSQAERLSAVLASQIEANTLPAEDPRRWLSSVPVQVAAFPTVAIVVFARPDGVVIGAVNAPDGMLVLEGADRRMVERPLHPPDPSDADRASAPRTRQYDFDPTVRPWYIAALGSPDPVWTDPYAFVRRDLPGFDVGTSFTRQIRRDGELVGVLSVDVTFGNLSAFLSAMPLAGAGRIAVVDDQGMLIAGSHTAATDGDGERRSAPRAFDPVLSAKAVARGGITVETLEIDGERHLGTATHLALGPRAGWTIVAAVPQAAVRQAATTTQVRLTLVSVVALLVTILASLWLGRRIVMPVRALRDHARRVGSGELGRPLDLVAAREFEELAVDINQMAVGLAERVALRQSIGVASQVQQALLPPASLRRPGIELFGCSRYCRSIGGDYFDYIELPARDAVLVAVGDVMGHGIDSALLMATARASVRAESRRTESLGAILVRVNSLLAGDAHGHFMTMFLLLIEPQRGRLRWGNAGHEAGVVVLPGADDCVDLEGGDIPLGIDHGVVYFEHSMEDLPEGSLVMIGTDGIREALDADNQAFGDARIRAILTSLAEEPLERIAAELLAQVEAHHGDRLFDDDLTFVLARLTRTDARS